MRILLVSHGYPPAGVGGVERLSLQSAETLTTRGHEVTVLTRRASNSPPQLTLSREVRNGVPVISVIGGGLPVEEFPKHESTMEGIFQRVLVEVQPDVVLITHLLHHSPGYVATAHRWGVPVVLELHDFFAVCPRAHLQRRSGELCEGPENGRACAAHCFPEHEETRLRWALRAESFREAVGHADVVLAPSRFLADELEPLRAANSPIVVLDNSVPTMGPVLPGERYPAGPLRIASIGVTIKHKGFHVVVDALRMAKLQAAQYTILGYTLQPLADEIQRAGEEIPGVDIRLVGDFSSRHLPVLLANSQLVVVPSLVAETYSIVVREAFACGLPVVASRIGALPEAIREGENGWLFEPGDAAELAVLLQNLDADRSQLLKAAEVAGRERLTSVGARVEEIDRLLAAAIAGSGHRIGDVEGVELGLMREELAEVDQKRRANLLRVARGVT